MVFPRKQFRLLRRRCETVAAELPLPRPFDVKGLCALLAAERGRPIRLLELPGEDETLGAWLATERADLIFYKSDTTPPHQEHIILHELSHVICGHYAAEDADDVRDQLFPDLSPAVVRSVLRRSTYWSQEEQEAELLATMIWRRGRRESGAAPAGAPPPRRVDAALAWPEGDAATRPSARGE